jgi:hypothetical protein
MSRYEDDRLERAAALLATLSPYSLNEAAAIIRAIAVGAPLSEIVVLLSNSLNDIDRLRDVDLRGTAAGASFQQALRDGKITTEVMIDGKPYSLVVRPYE